MFWFILLDRISQIAQSRTYVVSEVGLEVIRGPTHLKSIYSLQLIQVLAPDDYVEDGGPEAV